MAEISENLDTTKSKPAVKINSLSWIERLTQWIRSLPGPAWIPYLVMLLVLGFINIAVLWLAGVLPVGSIDPQNATDALWVVFYIGFFDYLSISAKNALKKFRPLSSTDESGYALLENKFTKLPARQGWVALAIAIVVLSASYFTSDTRTAFLSFPLITNVYQIFFRLLAMSSFLCLVFQSTRQIYLVSKLHREVKNVNLFHLGPAHAFSILTSKMGMGLALIATFGVFQLVFLHIAAVFAIFDLTLLLVAAAAFVLPLTGMRVKLLEERNAMLEKNDHRIEQMVNKFNLRIDADNLENIDDYPRALQALRTERNALQKISMWPWEIGTIRGFATTFLVPIFLWLITHYLDRFF